MKAAALCSLLEGRWPLPGTGAPPSRVRIWPAGEAGGWCALLADEELAANSRALFRPAHDPPAAVARAVRRGTASQLVEHPEVLTWLLGDDPALRGVADHDPGWRAAPSAPGALVGYKPLRRLVRRRFGADGRTTHFVKHLRRGHAARLASVHGVLEAWAAVDRGFRLPRLVEVCEQPDHLVWQTAPGHSLGATLRAGDDRAAVAAGRCVASLHACPVRSIQRVGPSDELRAVRRWLDLASPVSERPGALRTALSRLDALASSLPPSRPVLLHGDLHDGQILISDDGTTLLDTDTLCLGDAERDLGNLLAHFDLLRLEHPQLDTEGLESRLLQGYVAARRLRPAPLRLHWYRTASVLRLACVHALRSATRDVAPRLTLLAQRLAHRLPASKENTAS